MVYLLLLFLECKVEMKTFTMHLYSSSIQLRAMLILTAIHLYNNKKNSQQTFSDIAISLDQQCSCHIKGKGKGKRTIAVRNIPHCYRNSHATWDHSVTWHPTEVKFPPLKQQKLVLIKRPRMNARLSWPGWLVTYRDGMTKDGHPFRY